MDTTSQEKPKRSGTRFNPLLIIVGVLLLLPLFFAVVQARLSPLIYTFNTSLTKSTGFSEPEYIGSNNYTRIMQDAGYQASLRYSVQTVIQRMAIMLIIAPVVGLLAGLGGVIGRGLNRTLFALIGGFAAPAAIAILWSLYWEQMWGSEPSPLWEQYPNLLLTSQEGARANLLLLDALLTVALAVALGGTVFMAVMRGRTQSTATGRAGVGAWLMVGLLALVTLGQTFVIPFIVTAGGPGNATSTLSLELHNTTFRNLRLGYGAAEAMPLIVLAFVPILLLWLVQLFLDLRVVQAKPDARGQGENPISFVGLIFGLAALLPFVGLLMWGNNLVAANPNPEETSNLLNWRYAQSSLLTPLLTIWLLQLPAAWLGMLGLSFVRPLGRAISELLFLGLLLITLIPPEVLYGAWFMQAREVGILNTQSALGMPLSVNGFALLVLKFVFDGARDMYQQARVDGMSNGDALLRRVILPSALVTIVLGIVLSFGQMHEFGWSLIALYDLDLLPPIMQLVHLRGAFAAPPVPMVAETIKLLGIIAAVFVPLFLLAQVIADRFALVSGTTFKQKNDANAASMTDDNLS